MRGDGPWTPTCVVERARSTNGIVLTIRYEDGGFRRLLVTGGGHDVTAADGAMPARTVPMGDGAIEVAIGDERYRLPASVLR